MPEEPKSYVIIENTPGYLPDDDDPPTYDSYAEALRALVEYNTELDDEEEIVTEITDDEAIWAKRYRVGPIENGWFQYFSNDRDPQHDLGRFVQIFPVGDEEW